MKRALIVFAKEPTRGRVKTRLTPYLSERRCLQLYKELLQDTVNVARKIQCSRKIVAYDALDSKTPFLKTIASDFELYRQRGKDLGAKMSDAFTAFIKNGAKVVIIGSDLPRLPPRYINRAFRELSKNDVVLGPAYDGGYYLIGLKQPCAKMFEGIHWSSGSVFDDTLKKARRFKKKAAILDFWYDIDTPEDLKYL